MYNNRSAKPSGTYYGSGADRTSSNLYERQFGVRQPPSQPGSTTANRSHMSGVNRSYSSVKHNSLKAPPANQVSGANPYGARNASNSTSYGQKFGEQARRSQNAYSMGPGQHRTPVQSSTKAAGLSSRRSQESFKRYQDVFTRSYLADEFVIKNPSLNMSCFLNVALQTLWVFPAVRMNMVAFCDMRTGGPQELQPLINAIQDFFQRAARSSEEDSVLRRIHMFDSTAIRRELFKLNYKSGEYMINYEADAFECFDHLLTLIHTWSQAASSGSPAKALAAANWRNTQSFRCDRSQGQQPCFVHNMFYLSASECRICSCGSMTPMRSLDKNLFAETIFMDDMIRSLDSMIQRSPDGISTKPEIKNKAIIGQFFKACKEVKENRKKGCVEDQNAAAGGHTKAMLTQLDVSDAADFPEVLTLNLTWAQRNPPANSVLKTLVSIPEMFEVSQLYKHKAAQGQEYTLRGMICFAGNHYFAFFRRIFIKIGYLTGLDYSRIQEQAREIKDGEVKPETEWMRYDDERLSFVRDNWTGVLSSCLESFAYPTVLFYEKLVSFEEDALYEPRRGFNLVGIEMADLQRLANMQGNSINEFGDDSLIAQQKAIERQIRKQNEPGYLVMWTHNVTQDNYKVSKESHRTLFDAQKKFNDIRAAQRREGPDNAIVLAHQGKSIDVRGDKELISDLKHDMVQHYKQLENNATEVEASAAVGSSPASQPSSSAASNKEEAKETRSGDRPQRELSVEEQHSAILKEVRLKMQPHNVYVHICNNGKCRGQGQMLHARNCVLCGQENLFHDQTMTVDPQNDAIVRDMLGKLHRYRKYGGKAPSFRNVSPRDEVPEVIKPQQSKPVEVASVSSQQPKLSPAKYEQPDADPEVKDISASQIRIGIPEKRGLAQQSSSSRQPPSQRQPVANQADDSANMEEFETHWRCWRCSRIYRMDDFCARCKVQVGDYDGQLDEILEQVKIERDEPNKPIPDQIVYETPSGPPSENLQRWKCPLCRKQYRNTKPECPSCDNKQGVAGPKKDNLVHGMDQLSISNGQQSLGPQEPNQQEQLAPGVWRCPICQIKNYESIEFEKCGKCGAPRPQRQAKSQQHAGSDEKASSVPEVEVPLQQDQWRCQVCTLVNTVENWTDSQQAYCDACGDRSEVTNDQIRTLIKAEQELGNRNNQCKHCGREISAVLGYCIICRDKDSRESAKDNSCVICNQKLYLKNANYCFRCQPKCSECRIMRVEADQELCMTCLNQQKREQERLSQHYQSSNLSSSFTGGMINDQSRFSVAQKLKGQCPQCGKSSVFETVKSSAQRMMCGVCYCVVDSSQISFLDSRPSRQGTGVGRNTVNLAGQGAGISRAGQRRPPSSGLSGAQSIYGRRNTSTRSDGQPKWR